MTAKLKVLDLFSGIGGFSLGLEATGGFETIAFCEINPFCQKILRKHWPDVPIVSDVRKLRYNRTTQELIYEEEVIYVGPIDVITGGYPCQGESLAGKRKGKEDDRHLWPAMFDIVKDVGANWVLGENVVGHVTMGLDDVLADLECETYTARTFIIPACSIGAPHRRERVWIIANALSINTQGRTFESSPIFTGIQVKLRRSAETIAIRRHEGQSDVLGVDNGLPREVDRIKSIGNAVVPWIPQRFGNAILESYK